MYKIITWFKNKRLYYSIMPLINRTGNKTTDIKFFIDYLPMDVKTVVEPFGGSFAVIRDVYADKKYKKIVNDADDILYYIYKHAEEYAKLKIYLSKNFDADMPREKIVKAVKNMDFIDEKVRAFYLRNECFFNCNISKKVADYKDELNFIKSIKFYNEDYKDIIEKYLYNKNAFIS